MDSLDFPALALGESVSLPVGIGESIVEVDFVLVIFSNVLDDFLSDNLFVDAGVFTKDDNPSYDGVKSFLGVTNICLIPLIFGVFISFGVFNNSLIPPSRGLLTSLGVFSIRLKPLISGVLVSFGDINNGLIPANLGVLVSFSETNIRLIPAILGVFWDLGEIIIFLIPLISGVFISFGDAIIFLIPFIFGVLGSRNIFLGLACDEIGDTNVSRGIAGVFIESKSKVVSFRGEVS